MKLIFYFIIINIYIQNNGSKYLSKKNNKKIPINSVKKQDKNKPSLNSIKKKKVKIQWGFIESSKNQRIFHNGFKLLKIKFMIFSIIKKKNQQKKQKRI